MPSTAADSFSHKKTKQTNDCLMPVSDAHRCKVSQQEISEKKKQLMMLHLFCSLGTKACQILREKHGVSHLVCSDHEFMP